MLCIHVYTDSHMYAYVRFYSSLENADLQNLIIVTKCTTSTYTSLSNKAITNTVKPETLVKGNFDESSLQKL